MQRVHDSTVITLLTDSLPGASTSSYVKDRKLAQVPRQQQKGKSFDGCFVSAGEFPKV